ncbi:MAG: hypothetical protein ACLFR2_13375 [Candidatus Kapaibacterium sp.]
MSENKEYTMSENKEYTVKNVIRDTRREITYEIWADRNLSREEMLRQVKLFNYETINIRQKRGARVKLYAREM